MREALSKTAKLGCGALLVGVALGAQAGGMDVKPGSWEMKSTTTNPMTGQPQTYTATECIDRESMDPRSFMKEAEGCSVSDVETSSSSMSWTMVCSAPGGQMKGRAKIQSSAGGEKVAGAMNMSASFSGQTMNFATDWTGRWAGPCD